MSVKSDSLVQKGTPTYLESGDPVVSDYYPAWLDNLADDVTIEGSMLDGAVQGPEAVRALIGAARTLYDGSQKMHHAGAWGDNGFLEDYIAQVDGKPLGGLVLITRDAAGQTQHVVATYRPRSSVLHFSRLLGEKFAGTPFAEQFATGEE